jgi:hypothetical protein
MTSVAAARPRDGTFFPLAKHVETALGTPQAMTRWIGPGRAEGRFPPACPGTATRANAGAPSRINRAS